MIMDSARSFGLILLAVFIADVTCLNGRMDTLPAPAFSMNLTQDDNFGVEKQVFRRLGASNSGDPETAPMFEGLGTHYSFIWVGTPAQRVSVIMDTGSHHTAFPCTGCKCGKHMDPHFDPKQSSSSSIKSCGGEGKKCYFKQSYTEGSSWSAFKVRDKVWIGGPGKEDIHTANARSIDFDFGCQESETGLFRTQKVDGIMGLSAAPDTLPFQLHAIGLTKTKMFGLCFRTGGGVVTLGGVDTALHLPQQRGLAAAQYSANRTSVGGVYFAALIKPKGWYTVKLIDVLMRPNTGGTDKIGVPEAKSIGGDASRYNAGKGTIVDSGTTDTYLPASLRSQFQALFRTLTGKEYGNKQAFYSKEQFAKLPVIVFRLLGERGVGTLDLEVFPTSYMEHHKEGSGSAGSGGRYTPRIYLTEGTGAVLGANAIHEHNVIFDPDGMRVGFARSYCTYDKDHSSHDFATSTNAPTNTLTAPVVNNKTSKDKWNAGKEVPKISVPKSPAAPKSAPPKKVSKPTHKPPVIMKGPGIPNIGVPGTGVLFGVELSGIQKDSLTDIVDTAAISLVKSRHVACKPVLVMPCNARCDRQPGPEAQALDFGMSKSSESRLEYLQVDDFGDVSVGAASLIKGQQYWKVPTCEATAAAVRALGDAPVDASTSTVPATTPPVTALSAATAADWTSLGTVEAEAEELRSQLQQHRITAEECTVVCPLFVPSGDSVLDAARALPVRVNTRAGVDDTASVCSTHAQTRKRLTVRNTLVDTAGEANVVTLNPTSTSENKVLCYAVSNAHAVNGAAPTTTSDAENREDAKKIAPGKCKTATVVEESCRPYHFNCTAAAKSNTVPGSGVDDVVVAVHMRIKGLHYGSLPAYQESDLIGAFASIFKLPAKSVSVAMSPPVAGFSFAALGQSSIQVYLRFNPTAEDSVVPKDLLQMVARISSLKKTPKLSVAAVQRSLLSTHIAQLVHAATKIPTFPEVLATAAAEAYVTNEYPKHGWLVAGGVTFLGASALHAEVIGAREQALAAATDVSTCATVYSPWKEYFNFAGNSLLDPADLAAQASKVPVALLYGVGCFVLGLVLLGATVLLTRRYSRERERDIRESRSSAKSTYNVDATSPTSAGPAGSDDSDVESAPITPSNSQKSANSHRDRRRKVLQKFSFKR